MEMVVTALGKPDSQTRVMPGGNEWAVCIAALPTPVNYWRLPCVYPHNTNCQAT